jgi:hypothetical protein
MERKKCSSTTSKRKEEISICTQRLISCNYGVQVQHMLATPGLSVLAQLAHAGLQNTGYKFRHRGNLMQNGVHLLIYPFVWCGGTSLSTSKFTSRTAAIQSKKRKSLHRNPLMEVRHDELKLCDTDRLSVLKLQPGSARLRAELMEAS